MKLELYGSIRCMGYGLLVVLLNVIGNPPVALAQESPVREGETLVPALEKNGSRSLAKIVFSSSDARQQRWANSNPEIVQAIIIDFNATSILLQLPDDPTIKTRSSLDVIDIDFQWIVPDAATAEIAFQKGDYAEVVRIGKSIVTSEELPSWQKRILVSRMVEALSNADQKVIAGKLFLSLMKDSAPSLVYRASPLLLQNSKINSSMLTTAEVWSQDGSSVDSQLLGASWLLNSPKSEAAKTILQRISSDKNATVARLAVSQLWRVATPKEVASNYQEWKDLRDSLPVWLQGGPSFIIAEKLERASLVNEALQEYIRIISLHKPYDWVTKESILRATEILKSQNRLEEANLLGK